MGQHGPDCTLPADVFTFGEASVQWWLMSAMPNAAKCPFLTLFSTILQLVLAQTIYNICLHTAGEFSFQLVRTGNNSPEVNIKVACQEVWKNTYQKKGS